MDIGQAETSSLIAERQLFVIDSQLVQQCGVQIVNRYGISGYIVTPLIRLTVCGAGLDASTCHPHGETSGMVVPSEILCQMPWQ